MSASMETLTCFCFPFFTSSEYYLAVLRISATRPKASCIKYSKSNFWFERAKVNVLATSLTKGKLATIWSFFSSLMIKWKGQMVKSLFCSKWTNNAYTFFSYLGGTTACSIWPSCWAVCIKSGQISDYAHKSLIEKFSMLNLALVNLFAMASEKSIPLICKSVMFWPNSFSRRKASEDMQTTTRNLT